MSSDVNHNSDPRLMKTVLLFFFSCTYAVSLNRFGIFYRILIHVGSFQFMRAIFNFTYRRVLKTCKFSNDQLDDSVRQRAT